MMPEAVAIAPCAVAASSRGTARGKGSAETAPFVSLQTVVERNKKHYIPVVFGMGEGGEEKANAVFASLRFVR